MLACFYCRPCHGQGDPSHSPGEAVRDETAGVPGETLVRIDALIADWQFAAAESLCASLQERFQDESTGAAPFDAADVALRRVRLARARGDTTALSQAADLVHLLKAAPGQGDGNLVPALLEYAQALKKPGRYDESAAVLDECSRIVSRASPVDSLLMARTLQDRAALLMERRNYGAAEPLVRQAWGIRRRLRGDNDRDTAWSLLYIAILESQTGRPAAATRDFDSAVAAVGAARGHRHADYLWALNARAAFVQNQGDAKSARADYEYILKVRRERGAPEDAGLAWTINSLAIICQEQTDFAVAESLYAEALRIRRKELGEEHWLTARSLTNCGAMLFYRGDYLKARELLEDGLRVFRKCHMDHDNDAGLCLLDLGTMHHLTGDMETAGAYYDSARAVFAGNRYARPQDVLVSLDGLGACAMAREMPAKAEQYYRAALDTALVRFGPSSHWTGTARIDLALCLSARKRAAAADSQFAAGLATLEQVSGANSYDFGEALASHGREMLARGRYGKAAADFRRSLDLMREDVEPSHPALIGDWIGLAEAAEGSGRLAEARETALKAHDLEMRHLHDNLGYMTERHALLYRDALESAADVAVSVLAAERSPSPKSVERTWEAVLNGRILVLDELIARGREERGCPADERTAFAAFRAARSRLANLYVRAAASHADEKYGKLLEKAVREREAAERAWAGAVVHRTGTGYHPIALSRVLARLPSGAVLVAYVRYRNAVRAGGGGPADAYAAFVARRSGGIAFVPLGDAAPIDAAVDAWRAHMQQASNQLRADPGAADSACFEVGDRLRKRIWDPVVPHLGPASRVVLVPDGPLHLVSIPALPLDRSRFVVEEDRLICGLTAEKDLLRPAAGVGRGLLAMGDPDFDTAVPPADGRPPEPVTLALRGTPEDCRALNDFTFERLPGTGDEVRGVAGLWRTLRASAGGAVAPVALVGPAATEGEFKRLAPGSRLIHLATHGFFVAEDCAPLPRSVSRRLAGAGLRSGLALAGANTRGGTDPEAARSAGDAGAPARGAGARAPADDGILTAEEIGGLDLRGVELAVLSACNSGQGEAAGGEGIFGLRRAFQAAGVHDLVMTLWPVGDRATGEWIDLFYRKLWGGAVDPASAARSASLTILAERRRAKRSTHPFYWGGFITVGDD